MPIVCENTALSNWSEYGELQRWTGKSKSSVATNAPIANTSILVNNQGNSTTSHAGPTTFVGCIHRVDISSVGSILEKKNLSTPFVPPPPHVSLTRSALNRDPIKAHPPCRPKCLQPAFTWAIFPAMVRKSELQAPLFSGRMPCA